MGTAMRRKDEVEISVLKRLGLRYSILAAWDGKLREQGVVVPASVTQPLERARVKISSGCFPVCDVGCDLGRIEAILFSIATSSGQENADEWLDTLGECMSEKSNLEEIQKKIPFPAVKMHFNRFNFDGACGACEQ